MKKLLKIISLALLASSLALSLSGCKEKTESQSVFPNGLFGSTTTSTGVPAVSSTGAAQTSAPLTSASVFESVTSAITEAETTASATVAKTTEPYYTAPDTHRFENGTLKYEWLSITLPEDFTVLEEDGVTLAQPTDYPSRFGDIRFSSFKGEPDIMTDEMIEETISHFEETYGKASDVTHGRYKTGKNDQVECVYFAFSVKSAGMNIRSMSYYYFYAGNIIMITFTDMEDQNKESYKKSIESITFDLPSGSDPSDELAILEYCGVSIPYPDDFELTDYSGGYIARSSSHGDNIVVLKTNALSEEWFTEENLRKSLKTTISVMAGSSDFDILDITISKGKIGDYSVIKTSDKISFAGTEMRQKSVVILSESGNIEISYTLVDGYYEEEFEKSIAGIVISGLSLPSETEKGKTDVDFKQYKYGGISLLVPDSFSEKTINGYTMLVSPGYPVKSDVIAFDSTVSYQLAALVSDEEFKSTLTASFDECGTITVNRGYIGTDLINRHSLVTVKGSGKKTGVKLTVTNCFVFLTGKIVTLSFVSSSSEYDEAFEKAIQSISAD